MSINNPITNLITPINQNKKYIIMGIFVLLLVTVGYFLFSTKDKSPTDKGGGVVCKYGVDKDGKCKDAPTCYGNPPILECKEGQTLICDPILQNFRCRIDDCESDQNPFPYDFQCDPSKIKCDSNKRYYCDNGDDYCNNGGILYSNGNGLCSCPKSFMGDKCECDTTVCNGGKFDCKSKKCQSCCNSITSIDGKCNFYGDDCKQNCDDNEVYDYEQQKCICPGNSCFKIDNGKCVQLSTSDCCANGTIQDGKCICNDGWTGVYCDIPICGENGKWDDNEKKCKCYTDDNGVPLATGDNCEYSRDKLCNGRGTPYVFNGVASCKCDNGFSGEHCTCKDSEKPTDIFECKGLYTSCDEKSNGDGTYSGNWTIKNKNCQSLFSKYGGQNKWEEICTSQIYPNYNYPDYYAICTDNIDGKPTFNISAKTCNAAPTDDDLKECRATEDCFVSWDRMDNTKTYTSYCMCDNTENGPSYTCKPSSTNNICGPKPDENIFCSGGIVNCHKCGSSKFSYACEGSILPKDCVIYNNDLKPNLYNGKYWYNDKNKIPIFPVSDIDGCYFNALNDKETLFQSLKSLDDGTGSGPGFVKGLNNPDETPKFYSYNDRNVISYNINADISSDGKIIIDDNKPFPFNNNQQIPSDRDLFFNDPKNEYKNTAGCGRLRTSYDKNVDDNTSCALGPDGKERGVFKQYCADSEKNIIDCSQNPYYRTNKGYCECTQKYYSNVQQSDVHYKGRYCQYSDNETCNGKGTVDDKGNCQCLSGYLGSNCQYSSKTCNDRGVVRDDGSCICSLYTSNSDNKEKHYRGPNCQYDDNSTCKGQGKVDDNGNCNWIPSKVFPRCAELTNPDETNYDNLQCKTTINSDLFTTDCVKKGLTDTPPNEYGCPINKSSVIWSQYTGYACHTKDADGNRCINGAYPIRITSDTASGQCQNNGEGFLFDSCRLDDVSKVDSLNYIDFSGISNKTVTGVGLVACQRFNPQGITLVNSNNNTMDTPNYIQDGSKAACWGNGTYNKINYVSNTDWFNLPIGQGGIQQRI